MSRTSYDYLMYIRFWLYPTKLTFCKLFALKSFTFQFRSTICHHGPQQCKKKLTISSQCTISIKKPRFSDAFKGYRNGALPSNRLRPKNLSTPLCNATKN